MQLRMGLILNPQSILMQLSRQMISQKRLLDRIKRIQVGKSSINIIFSLIQLLGGLKHPARQRTFVFGSSDLSSNLLQTLHVGGVVGGSLFVVLTQQGHLFSKGRERGVRRGLKKHRTNNEHRRKKEKEKRIKKIKKNLQSSFGASINLLLG